MKKLIFTLTLTLVTTYAPYSLSADGEAIYKKACFACHDFGAAGAPKKGDAAAWGPRISKGVDALVGSVTNGLNAMPPKGTCMDCSDADLRAAVEFLVAQAGGSSAAAPAPATSVPQPESQPEAKPEMKDESPEQATKPGDAAAGQTKAALCIACHGPDGNSVNPEWPKLAGQHENYLVKQLQAFQTGERQNEMMAPMAAPLKPQDILDVAAYFSKQKTSESQGNAELQDAGQRLYTGGNLATGVVACAGCHGPSGVGNPAGGFPRLAGQHAAYVAKALKDYRAGSRSNDRNAMMRGVASKLTDAEIAAVAEYITNLK